MITSEQISSTYDALNRLATAGSSLWNESYTYDGFGNLSQTLRNGSTQTVNVTYNPLTNRRTVDCADSPGNITNGALGCGSYSYDAENRLATAPGNVYYGYAPGNKRIWRGKFEYDAGAPYGGGQRLTTDELTFYGVNGQKLATYSLVDRFGCQQAQQICYPPYSYGTAKLWANQTGTFAYFGGKLVKNAWQWCTRISEGRWANTIRMARSGRRRRMGRRSSPPILGIARPGSITPIRGITRQGRGGL